MTKRLTYEQIQEGALAGYRLRTLARCLRVNHPCDPIGPLGYLDADEYRRLADKVIGIRAVLEMLGQTPNAYINREALDEMASYVEEAKGYLAEEWIQEVLKNADDILQTPDDQRIPF